MLAQYFTFQGRATRQQYWMLFLANIAASLVAIAIDNAVLNTPGVFQTIVALAFIVPGLSVGVRRFHDRDKSGWWLLIAFIPLVGAIWLIVELGFLRGTYGPNRFGPDPLGGEAIGYGYPPQQQPYPGQYPAPQGYYPPQEGYPQSGHPQQQPYPQQPYPQSYDAPPNHYPPQPPQGR